MPNAIKYSTTGDTLSLKKGNIFFGVGDVGKGPSSATTYYNGVTPSASGYTIYSYNASQTSKLSFHSAANEAALRDYTNRVSGQSFVSAAQCLNWYATQTDYVCVNEDYESIVMSGLTLCLDAGFTPSYPTTNTTWYDLSYSDKNGTLTNGTSYSTDGGGTIVFDGVDDYVDISNPSNLQTQNFTISIWVNPSSATNAITAIVDYDHGVGQGWVIQSEDATTNRYFYLAYYDGSVYQPATGIGVGKGVQLTNSVWQNLSFTKNGTSIIGYLNGSQIFTSTAGNGNVSYLANKNLRIGNTVSINGRNYNGKFSSTQIYNRSLTANEITQNFFALVPIIRNGLVFNLVAGNPISYRTGSSVWIDPIGGSRGTLTNGPTFSSSGSSSSIVFDGSDDAVIWSSNPLSSLTTAKTYELWVRFDSTIVNTFTISCGTYMVYLENKNTWYINQAGASNSFVSWTFNSGWNHFVYSFDGSNHLCYINGTSRTINFGSGVGSQTNLYIGNRVNMDSPMKGNIAITRMYNRGLSATEITQNFNTQRSVFGI